MKKTGLILAVLSLSLLTASCEMTENGQPNFAQRVAREKPLPRISIGSIEIVNPMPLGEFTPPIEEIKIIEKKNYHELRVTATAYCPCARCCGRMTGRTSTGSNAWKPGVAVSREVNRRVVSLGSVIVVPGYNDEQKIVVDDVGGGVKGIDVRMTYHWQARQWGRKAITIRVYDSITPR
jgi:3D (Asp-Asp-Asp) domain-containing protein